MDMQMKTGNFEKCIDLYVGSIFYKKNSFADVLLLKINEKCKEVLRNLEAKISFLLKEFISLPAGIQLLNVLKRINELNDGKENNQKIAKVFISCREVYLKTKLPQQNDFDSLRHYFFDLITLFKLVFPDNLGVLSSYLLFKFEELEPLENNGSKIYFGGSMARIGWDFRAHLLKLK